MNARLDAIDQITHRSGRKLAWLCIAMALLTCTIVILRNIVPTGLSNEAIYKGVIPFILIQVTVMGLLWYWSNPDISPVNGKSVAVLMKYPG